MQLSLEGSGHALLEWFIIEVFEVSYSSLAGVPTWVLVVGAAIGLGLIFGHAWLSRRNPVWLGAIGPSIYVMANIGFAVAEPPRGGEIIGGGLTLVALLIIWWAGEDARKRRRGESASS